MTFRPRMTIAKLRHCFFFLHTKTIKSTIIFGDREQNFDLLVHSTHYSRNFKELSKKFKIIDTYVSIYLMHFNQFFC